MLSLPSTSAAPTGAEAQEQSFLNQDEPHKEIEATLTSRQETMALYLIQNFESLDHGCEGRSLAQYML